MDIPTPLLLLLVSVTRVFYLPLDYFPCQGAVGKPPALPLELLYIRSVDHNKACIQMVT
jgi:hypothetical protein